MINRFIGSTTLILGVACFAGGAADRPELEWLLPSGTLYSMASRSYRSLRLPEGWNVLAGAYSPDDQALAFLLFGSGITPKIKPALLPPEGPVYKTVRLWQNSTRLIILDRRTGVVKRSWRILGSTTTSDWTVAWADASRVSVTAHDPSAPVEKARLIFGFDVTRNIALKPQPAAGITTPPAVSDGCPRTLAETEFQGKHERFILESGSCSTPPEKSDFYRLVRQNEQTRKDAILWEYRVAADTTTCSGPYMCYTGGDVQFLQSENRLFLVWDGDLYAVRDTEEGQSVELMTQLLPQYSHPWGLATGETRLSTLDVATKVAFQSVNSNLSIAHGNNPTLYAQNFCPTRSFSAAVDISPFTTTLMTPAGYQVGPVEIDSFKDRAYTPVLISVIWTAFHQISDPVQCKEPYTVAPHTKGIVVSLTENEGGALQCQIHTQENH